MQVALLNLMPEKPKTETQLARLLGATPLQVELTLLTTSTYRPQHGAAVAPADLLPHLGGGQRPQVRRADHHRRAGRAAAVRGGQVLARADPDPRLVAHQRAQLRSTSAGARRRPSTISTACPSTRCRPSASACSRHHVIERHDQRRPALMRGFDDYFLVPVSRHTEVRAADLPTDAGLEVLAACDTAGLCLVHEPRVPHGLHVQPSRVRHLHPARRILPRPGHARRRRRCRSTTIPDDDPEKAPRNCWRAYAHLLFGNWINEMYQTTPYDLAQIGAGDQAHAA